MKNFREILSWIFLLVSIVLVSWLIFGNSPTELAIFSVIVGFVLVKMFDNEKRLTCVEMGMRNGFSNMKRDINLIKEKLENN